MREMAVRDRGIALYRITAMVLRYWYLLMSSWPRLLELVYWPALQIITWASLRNSTSRASASLARAGGTRTAAGSFWAILFGARLGSSFWFLDGWWGANSG